MRSFRERCNPHFSGTAFAPEIHFNSLSGDRFTRKGWRSGIPPFWLPHPYKHTHTHTEVGIEHNPSLGRQTLLFTVASSTPCGPVIRLLPHISSCGWGYCLLNGILLIRPSEGYSNLSNNISCAMSAFVMMAMAKEIFRGFSVNISIYFPFTTFFFSSLHLVVIASCWSLVSVKQICRGELTSHWRTESMCNVCVMAFFKYKLK